MSENIQTLTSKKSLLGGLIDDDFLMGILIALFITIGINIFIRPIIVRGVSMEPTFKDGEFCIVDKRAEVKRDDIVVFWKDHEYLIKRVVAVGGDEVSSRDGFIYVNGKAMGKGEVETQTIPDGQYFVMGDNRDFSMDSRAFGPIDKVMGKVSVRIYPRPSKTFPYTAMDKPPMKIELTSVKKEEPEFTWDGPVLSSSAGVVYGPSGKETYYNLDMSGVVEIMRGLGNEDEYWVRDDGCKMLGNYIMVAANLDTHPRGNLVETSLGTGIVCDTGGFAQNDPNQLDIATAW